MADVKTVYIVVDETGMHLGAYDVEKGDCATCIDTEPKQYGMVALALDYLRAAVQGLQGTSMQIEQLDKMQIRILSRDDNEGQESLFVIMPMVLGGARATVPFAWWDQDAYSASLVIPTVQVNTNLESPSVGDIEQAESAEEESDYFSNSDSVEVHDPFADATPEEEDYGKNVEYSMAEE